MITTSLPDKIFRTNYINRSVRDESQSEDNFYSIPPSAVRYIARLLDFVSNKYDKYNPGVKKPLNRYQDSLTRPLLDCVQVNLIKAQIRAIPERLAVMDPNEKQINKGQLTARTNDESYRRSPK
jgi:hypothetical protein